MSCSVFYALRGGGAGSWGVIVNATVRTFPTFSGTFSQIELGATTNAAAGALLAVHAQHIFDLDAVRGGQYFYLEKPGNVSVLVINTFTANTTLDEGTALLTPLVNDSLAVPGVFLVEKLIVTLSVNDALHMADDVAGVNIVMGSRFVPEAAYKDPNAPAIVAKIYEDLLDGGAQQYVSYYFLAPA
jgi:hypothetical protein